MASNRISPAALEVLKKSTWQDGKLYLPKETLERRLYVQVDDVIQRLGGKWNSKAKAHVFNAANNPAETGEWDEVVATGIMPDKNPDAYWPTPSPVVGEMLNIARVYELEVKPVQVILEPSAGEGNILGPFRSAFPFANVFGIELNDLRFAKIAKMPDVVVFHGDFLQMELAALAHKCDIVVMNPPFAVPGDSLAYISHIKHAVQKYLAPWGWLIAITPASVEFRMDRRTHNLRRFFDRFGNIKRLPQGSFDVVGTAVGTCLCTAYAPESWEWE